MVAHESDKLLCYGLVYHTVDKQCEISYSTERCMSGWLGMSGLDNHWRDYEAHRSRRSRGPYEALMIYVLTWDILWRRHHVVKMVQLTWRVPPRALHILLGFM
ncbi:hypothetical protein Fot_06219 [Forsythia ovata]|uniref:Uncharacterized protein n=1 Tax=Forsythia ovata TaxID=205694 RepID=A0ABD1WSC0_9LAMI